MSTNLIEEIARRDAKREELLFGIEASAERLVDLQRGLAPVVADVLDILSAEGRLASAIEPGLCWADSGIFWPNDVAPRCELRAGHAGAHECDRGSMGGTSVWTDGEAQR